MVMRPTGHGKVEQYRKVGTETHALLYNFDIDGASLKRKHIEFLDTQVVPILVGGGHVAITGMCSRSGSDAHNLRLSEQRAKQIVEYLGRWTNLSRVYYTPPTFAARGIGEATAAIAGAKDGSEDELHRAVYIIVSPKPIPTPAPAPGPVPAPQPQPPKVLWRTEELSLRADVLELPLYKRLNGHLYLTQGSCDYIRWHFTASLGSLALDPKGKPKIFVGDIKALGASLIYNDQIYEPGPIWSNKKISIRMNGQSITVTIGHAFPTPISANYNPVKRHGNVDIVANQDLSFTLQQAGGELGIVYGVGWLRPAKYVSGKCDYDGGIA